MVQDEAIYNIGVVARMTGIPAATLRIWERRYAFPVCARTEGGHRIYTRTEIDRLRWVKVKTDSGMQIRQAIRALETLDMQSELGATDFSTLNTLQELDMGLTPASESYLQILQKRLQANLLRHKLDVADTIFDEVMALYTPDDIIVHLIGPTLSGIGMGWEKGEVKIATEHLASHYLRQRLIVWMHVGPPTFDVPPVVLACAPGEYHEGGLLMFGALLRRRRWPVAYLGQSIPLVEVAAFVRQTAPSAIVMVAMT
ncbi:MAG: MerR family transcriptional regulator, partial [Anaerolineales bacterium]